MPEETLTLLKQREIEAKIVGPLFRAFAQEVGEARAREILAGVVRNLAPEAAVVPRSRRVAMSCCNSAPCSIAGGKAMR
jgi:hypothetical protein